jgi:ribosomal protein S18 acetylase RimI-like enzyme
MPSSLSSRHWFEAVQSAVRIIRGLPDGLEEAAVRIYAEALHAKLVPLLGNVERIVRLFKAYLVRDRCVCSVRDGKLTGLAGYWLDGKGLFEPDWKSFTTEYGIFSGTLRMFSLVVLERGKDSQTLLMDGIAVDETERSQGIGSKLLNEIKLIAGEHDKRQVRLDVIDTNPGARRLYERHGFEAISTSSIGFMSMIFPFKSSSTMILKLPQTRTGN